MHCWDEEHEPVLLPLWWQARRQARWQRRASAAATIDGEENDGGGGLGSPAAKSIGNHCGETVLGFDKIGLMIMRTDPALLNTLRAFRLSSAASTVEAVLARRNGSHCGGNATGCSASASLLATLGLVMCGMTAAQKAAATPMRTSAQKRVA